MTNKKSFFEKLTGGIKFSSDEEFEPKKTRYSHDEFEYDDEDDEIERLEINSDEDEDLYEEEEEIGELAIDMYRIDNAIIVKTMVAGIQKSDISISLTRDLLTIEGGRKNHLEGTLQETYTEELYWGAFERTIELPEEIDIELAEAHESHGLLTLTLPLVDKHRQTRLKIK